MSFFQLRNITKQYGSLKVLDDINLSIEQGEFISFLGESGSGKTTLLRIIAGLEEQFEGTIFLQNRNITAQPVQKRDVSMVFQDYLLFPHLNAIENIEFGLKIRGIAKRQRYKEAKKLLELVYMEDHENKYPHQLSGGQKQRIAIARAIITKPLLLLLDEPFSSLDTNLRADMCDFIKNIQRQIGITTILVTHDREEAMKLSDRIALLNKGNITQFDDAVKLYEKPSDLYTASFMGDLNILDEEGGYCIAIRPENIRMSSPDRDGCSNAVVKSLQYAGSRTKCRVLSGDREICFFLPGASEHIVPGSKIYIEMDRSKILKIKV